MVELPGLGASTLWRLEKMLQPALPLTLCLRVHALLLPLPSAGKRPVTIWMPVSPPGYAALGAVVRGEPEVPATEDYLCIR